MPMTDASPDFLHGVKMFAQKWSINSNYLGHQNVQESKVKV